MYDDRVGVTLPLELGDELNVRTEDDDVEATREVVDEDGEPYSAEGVRDAEGDDRRGICGRGAPALFECRENAVSKDEG